MRKRKHAAALFEVFHGTKTVDKRGQNALRTPRWWFKGQDEAATPEVDANDPTTMTIRSPLIAPRIAAVEAIDDSAPAKSVATKIAATAPSRIDRPAGPVERDPTDPTRSSLTPSWKIPTASSAKAFNIDRESREVTLRLQFSTLVAASFIVLLFMGMLYVLGRRAGATREAAATDLPSAQSTDDMNLSAPQPSALDVSRHNSKPLLSASGGTNRTGLRSTDDTRARDHDLGSSPPLANSVHGMNSFPPAAATPADGPRVVGMNYVIAQSYPNEPAALEAHSFLMKNGVSCTVEQGPPGWANMNWFSVISTHGFEHIHSPECETFKKQVERVGEKFAGNSQTKRFSPHLYSWK